MNKLLIIIYIIAFVLSNEIFSQDLSRTRIYFTSNRNGSSCNNADIYVVNIDGTGLKKIVSNPGYDWSPAWSPSMN